MLDKFFEILVNSCHIILATLAQAAILAYYIKTGKDIGPGVQNTLYAYYGFLGAHALTYQRYPDSNTGGH